MAIKAGNRPKQSSGGNDTTSPEAASSGRGRAPKRRGAKAAAGEHTATASGGADVWTLRLYVAGDSPKSRAALSNLQRLCDAHLPGKYEIEVVDLKTRPELAKIHEILAVPTLIRKIPEPVKRVIGDLSNAERALVGLELS